MRQILGLVILFGAVNTAHAVDVPIAGLKLTVVDKREVGGASKVVFTAKDSAITKGAGTDPTHIEATLGIVHDATSGAFDLPEGSAWIANSATVAKYVDVSAPTTKSVRVGMVKPASRLKVVAKSMGDSAAQLGISEPPAGPVYVGLTIVNEGLTTRLCARFLSCIHTARPGQSDGHVYKLVCKGGDGDPSCMGAFEVSSARFVDQGLTVLDKRTALEWERKTTVLGSGANPADLHDVDNRYDWAGTCSVATLKLCQPNPAATTACKAQTQPADWLAGGCEECAVGEGVCQVAAPSIATVWDWITQVNAESYAGHIDWRLASEDGRNTAVNDDPREWQTILLAPESCPNSFPPGCIQPLLSPAALGTWTGSTFAYSGSATMAWIGAPGTPFSVTEDSKAGSPNGIRAVRDTP